MSGEREREGSGDEYQPMTRVSAALGKTYIRPFVTLCPFPGVKVQIDQWFSSFPGRKPPEITISELGTA